MSREPRAATTRRISVAIVANDEHDVLAQTLSTARAIGDQVVVVDAGCDGKVSELAQAQRAVIVKRAWDDSFAAARNAALERATGDWIVWLEPGETMTAESAAALRQFVLAEADPNTVYMLVVTVPSAPGNISGEQVARVRLTPNGRGLKYKGRLRERLEPAPETLGLATEGLPWRIVRGERENDPAFKIDRARRNLELIKLDVAERGVQPCLLIARGEALSGLHDQKGARKTFREAIAVSLPNSSTLREAYYGLLTTYVDAADRQTQIKICLEALEKFPLDAQLLCAMGGYMQAEGRLDLSAQAYRTAADFGQIDPAAWHVPDIHEIAAICLSLTYQVRNQDDEGRQVLEHTLSRLPEAHRVRRHLIDLHVRHDRRKEALAEFDRLPSETPHREALRGAIRGACLAAKRDWVPAAAYLQTAYASGCRDLLCLRWLCVTLFETGQHEAALPVLREWKALDPRGVEAQKYMETIQASATGPATATPAIAAKTPQLVAPTKRVETPKPVGGGALSIPRLATSPTHDVAPARH